MISDEWRRVKEVAAEALAQPEADRLAYVTARCGAEESVFSEVLSLLEATAHAADLYEAPAFTAAGLVAALAEAGSSYDGSLIGRRIGAYKVVDEIGRGGMGAAFLAERADGAYEKRVAIKLIKRGMDTDAILRRFRHERQILARLDHPNIATLLDGGTTDDGLPYFVMEYVDGLPIDIFCDANRYSIRDRLKLFQAVCTAVHHAHERHVIHRDLKPTNILVTANGTPKLLDFGIAKLLDPEQSQTTEATLLARAMTPQYASPEQVRGEAMTPASDVYSLGIVLYQLLTGHHPYRLESRTPTEIERIICEEVPVRPSTVVGANTSNTHGEQPRQLRRRLAGALDAITLTALQKQPEQRYTTAKALADDLQRYLDGNPIAARRYPLAERMVLLVRSWTRMSRPAPAKPKNALILGSALAALSLVAATAVILGRLAPSGDTPQAIRSVAVLPLANSSGETELEYLCDGITEDLINRLSRASGLKVIARDSVYRYRGKPSDPQEVGRALGVEAVVTGRVLQRGTELSVSAELVDIRDGRQLWGEQYDRKISDLQFLQRELAQQIAQSLQLQLSGDKESRFLQHYTRDPEAYQLYLKGRYFWNKRTTGDVQKSIGYFQQAVEKDPLFALAYSGLADSYGILTEYHAVPASATYEPAKKAVTKALQLDEDLAEAHTSLAYLKQFYEWDWQGAETEFKRAIELNPTYPTAHQWYAEYLSALGRPDEALAEIRRAAEFDPLSPIIASVEANILYMARRYDQAIEQCQKVIDMDPNFAEVYEYLKRIYDQTGQYKEAIAARQTRRRILRRNTRETRALRIAASTTERQLYWQARLEQEFEEGKTEGLQPFEMAEMLSQRGKKQRALDWLEKACQESDFMMMYVRVAPNLDPLRSEPRFIDMLSRSCRTSQPSS